MELDGVPLAVTDPTWDVGRHRGLGLAWMTNKGEWWGSDVKGKGYKLSVKCPTRFILIICCQNE